MKLLKTILLIAVHGAQASHKVTTNAVEAETTHRLAAEAATAGVVKMPGAVAKLFGQAEGAEVRADQTQGAMGQHQEKFEGSPAPGKLGIYYLSVEGPPADFVLVDMDRGGLVRQRAGRKHRGLRGGGALLCAVLIYLRRRPRGH